MTRNQAPSTRVFSIPELAVAVFQFARPHTILSLRLVNRLFRDSCSPFFFITLDLANSKGYSELERIAETSTQSPTPENECGILHHTRGLKLNGRVHPDFESSAPLAHVLNRCRNLRHINIVDPGDKYGIGTHPEPSDPLLLWPVLMNLSSSNWSIFDCLPLEGTLLSRLQSLTIGINGSSPINLDDFFIRLSKSCAAQTLCSLAILGYWEQKREFSFYAFAESVSALKSLETLRIKDLQMLPADFSDYSDTQEPLFDQHLQQRPPSQYDDCPALKVKTLIYSGQVPPEFKVPLMDLFPNVESLDLGWPDLLLDKTTEQWISQVEDSASIFPNTAFYTSSMTPARNDGPLCARKVIPFPRLKALGEPDLSCRFWTESGFLQDWIERQPNFQLISLHLQQQHHASSNIQYVTRFMRILSEKAVTAKNLLIETRCEFMSIAALLSDLCRKIEVLEIKIRSIESAAVLLAAFKTSKSTKNLSLSTLEGQPILDTGFCREDLLHHFPWTGTLTRLCLSSGLDSRLDDILEPGSLAFMQLILRSSPHLVDFEMFEWITDLALFSGLGRAPLMAQNDGIAASGKDNSAWPYENERPHLRRLVLFQLPKGSEKQLRWRAQLEFRFRFLEEIVI